MSPVFPHSQPAAAHSTAVRAGKQQLCIRHSHQDTTRLAELERHRCPLVSPLPISGSHSAGSPCFGFSCTEFLSQQHRGAQHPKHRIIKDGKDLLRSSSPTINPSLSFFLLTDTAYLHHLSPKAPLWAQNLTILKINTLVQGQVGRSPGSPTQWGATSPQQGGGTKWVLRSLPTQTVL